MDVQAMEFYNAAAQMVRDLRNAAYEDRGFWQKDAIQSPLGPLVVVEYNSGANNVYRIAGGRKVCEHWPSADIMADIMRAAGYVKKVPS